MLSVPYFKQKTLHTCGPAVLRSVFAFYDKHFDEKQIEKWAHTTKARGTSRLDMLKTANRAGFKAYAKSNASFDDILEALSQKVPVIVRYLEPEGEEHYAIAIHLNADSITLSDPYHGPKTAYAKTDFLKMWKLKRSPNWLLVIC